MGVTRGRTFRFDLARGTHMERNENYNFDKDEGKTTKVLEKEKDMDMEFIGIGTAMINDGFKCLMNKRKLRVDLEGPKTQSAPTSPAANISVSDFIWDEEEARSVKRRKDDGGTKDILEEKDATESDKKLATKVRKIIRELDKEARAVAETAKERNTKREIKEGALKLKSLMSQLMTKETQVLLQTLGRNTAVVDEARDNEVEEKEKEIQDLKNEIEEKNKKLEEKEKEFQKLKREKSQLKEEIIKLQVEIKDLKKNEEKKYVEENMFTEADDYDKFLELEKMEWRRGIYKTAFPAEGSPLTVGKDTDTLMLHEEGTGSYNVNSNEALEKAFGDRHPELTDLDEKIAAIIINTKVMKVGEEATEKSKWIIRAELDLEGGGREWFNVLRSVRDLLIKNKRRKLAIYPPSPDTEGKMTRKMLEYVFRGTEVKCLMHTRPQAGGNKGRQGTTNKRNTEALIISQTGKSYSDLLKTIKQTVQPGTTPARAIRTIRESKDGKMVVILDKDTKAIEELKGKISGVEELKVKAKSEDDGKTVFIYDVDGLTTPDEVRDAICGEIKLSPEKIQVGDLRKSTGGNQVAIIKLPEEAAEQMLRRGRVRIGLSWCPIKERVDVLRCFRCWKYGHIAKECKETRDESKLCRKCGGGGHEAKGCMKEDYCLTCKIPGHVSGTGKCPEFKKALARERIRNKEKRRY